MLGTDPPRHRHLRSLVIQAFTQKRVAQLEPRIQAIAAQLLDELAQADTPDLVSAFAYPLPVMVIGELLGVPAHEAPQFRQWAIDFVGNDYELRMQTARAISGYFDRRGPRRAHDALGSDRGVLAAADRGPRDHRDTHWQRHVVLR
jgi:cytochrome P450